MGLTDQIPTVALPLWKPWLKGAGLMKAGAPIAGMMADKMFGENLLGMETW